MHTDFELHHRWPLRISNMINFVTFGIKQTPTTGVDNLRAWSSIGLKTVLHREEECELLAKAYGIADVYYAAPINIQRVDLCKYMVVHKYKYGGFLADLDVKPLTPLEQWVPSDIDIVLIWEGRTIDLV